MATKTVATADMMANFLVTGYWTGNGGIAHKWGSSNVTYSFNSGWSAAEKLSVARAFAAWSDVANISFTEAASGGSITFKKGTDGGAWSSSPYSWGNGTVGTITSSTISIDTRIWGWDDLVTIGKYGLMTLIHEIGHTIGLGHAGPYNGGGSYDANAIYDKDTRQYTLMSYWDASISGASHAGQYASTALLYDIYAVQKIYGAKTSTRAGDTVYGFHSTAGSDQFDFTKTTKPVIAIWDGGGSDTLDLSGYSTASRIDLTPGGYSDAGGLTKNIAIAYGTTIENAIGGSGNDSILGNDANNVLTGGGGNDSIDGGGGTNTAVFTGNRADYDIVTASGAITVTDHVSGRDGTDTLRNVQYLKFADQTVAGGTSPSTRAPVVTAAAPQTVSTGHAIAVSSLFSVSDPDGNAITQYQIYDPAGGGSIRLNGAVNLLGDAYSAAGYYRVSAADLAKLTYVGGASTGSESLTVWAYDGTAWGAGTVAVGSRAGAPVVTAAAPQTVSTSHAIAVSSLFSASDPDGNAITQYQIYDPAGGGSIRLNGAVNLLGNASSAAGYYRVSAADLAKLTYVGGAAAGSESLTVWAWDGNAWGAGTLAMTSQPGASTVPAAARQTTAMRMADALGANQQPDAPAAAWSSGGSLAGSFDDTRTNRTGGLAVMLS